MNCTQVRQNVDSWVDDELTGEDRIRVDRHLEQCESCRHWFDERREENRRWQAAFEPERDSAGRVTRAVIQRLPVSSTASEARHATGWHLLLALAAGFLLALVIFPPWKQTPRETTPLPLPSVGAKLSLVSGEVELSQDQASTWLKCPEPAPINLACRLRTDMESRCELQTDNGAVLRLNTETDVDLSEPDEVQLRRGQIWCQSGEADRWKIKTGETELTVAGACDVLAQPDATEIVVCEGQTTVRGSEWFTTLEAGQSARLVGGQLDDTDQVDPLLATRWVHHLLALRSVTDQETTERIEHLWSAVGKAKLAYLYEEELRVLGSQCCVPLLAYLNSQDSRKSADKRAKAARIVADVANHRHAPDLIHLLDDDQADVRLHAARGLERLTGHNFGVSSGDWHSGSPALRQPALAQWNRWLKTNRTRFPKSVPMKKGG